MVLYESLEHQPQKGPVTKKVVKNRMEQDASILLGGLGQGTYGTAEGEVLFVQFNVNDLVLHTQTKNAWFDDIA